MRLPSRSFYEVLLRLLARQDEAPDLHRLLNSRSALQRCHHSGDIHRPISVGQGARRGTPSEGGVRNPRWRVDKRISRSTASGTISTGRLTRPVKPSISCSEPSATRWARGASVKKSIAQNGAPETVSIDKSGSNLSRLDAVNAGR